MSYVAPIKNFALAAGHFFAVTLPCAIAVRNTTELALRVMQSLANFGMNLCRGEKSAEEVSGGGDRKWVSLPDFGLRMKGNTNEIGKGLAKAAVIAAVGAYAFAKTNSVPTYLNFAFKATLL